MYRTEGSRRRRRRGRCRFLKASPNEAHRGLEKYDGDADGRIYYANVKTKTTQWTLPDEFKQAAAAPAPPAAAGSAAATAATTTAG